MLFRLPFLISGGTKENMALSYEFIPHSSRIAAAYDDLQPASTIQSISWNKSIVASENCATFVHLLGTKAASCV